MTIGAAGPDKAETIPAIAPAIAKPTALIYSEWAMRSGMGVWNSQSLVGIGVLCHIPFAGHVSQQSLEFSGLQVLFNT